MASELSVEEHGVFAQIPNFVFISPAALAALLEMVNLVQQLQLFLLISLVY